MAPASLKALSQKSDRAGAVQTGLHLGAITMGAAAVLIAPTWWLTLLGMLALGVLLVALFAPLHETAHRTVFAAHWANTALAQLAGFILLIPPVWFRHYHMAHHRHTQDPDHDPELARPKPTSLARYAWHLTGVPTWISLIRALVLLAAGRTQAMAYVPGHARADVVANARWHIAGYGAVVAVSVWLQSPVALLIWIGPLVLAQPLLRAYLLAEHTGCAIVPDVTRNTRTTLASRLLCWLAWNMPYHAEHHLYPSVPFHRLPDLHTQIAPALGHVTDGYGAAHREIRGGFA